MSVSKRMRRLALATGIATLGALSFAGTALAGTVVKVGATVTYTAAPGDFEQLTITQDAVNITFNDANIAIVAGPGCTPIPATAPATDNDARCPVAGVTSIVVNAGDNDDAVYASNIQAPISLTLNGETGNDTLFGGAGTDILDGGVGSDTLSGNEGNDTLRGGSDTDTLLGGDGDDNLDTGAGASDSADGENGNDSITSPADYVTLTGGPGDDQMTSSGLSVTLNGDNGNDSLSASGLFSRLNGGAGNDTLNTTGRGGRLFGDDGDDVLNGGDGNSDLGREALHGGAGNDTLNANAGDDDLYGESGNDVLNGGAGDDLLDGGLGADVFNGGAGSDNADYSGRSEALTIDLRSAGGDGAAGENDTVDGSIENIEAGSGPDTITTVVSTKFVSGNAGNDTIVLTGTVAPLVNASGGPGDDVIDATALVSSSSDTIAFLHGNAGNDTLRGGAARTSMFGEDGNDTLTGGAASEVLEGGDGLDTLTGGAGNDQFDGGTHYTDVAPTGFGNEDTYTSDGADTITGGDGYDTVRYGDRSVGVTVDLSVAGGDGQTGENDNVTTMEAVEGSRGADVLVGDDLSNTIRGLGGSDQITGKGGFDQLFGGADADTINASSDGLADLVSCGEGATVNPDGSAAGADADTAVLDYLDVIAGDAGCETVNRAKAPLGVPTLGTTGNDVMLGTRLGDTLFGLAGNDTIRGFAGNDELRGGPDNDKLYGGLGKDLLEGDAGNDVLSGDAGDDTLNGGAGKDVLLGGAGSDFLIGNAGADKLNGGPGKDFLLARDGARGDVITCTKLNLRNRFLAKQRDIVVADRGDRVLNRAYCASVSFV